MLHEEELGWNLDNDWRGDKSEGGSVFPFTSAPTYQGVLAPIAELYNDFYEYDDPDAAADADEVL